jgi:hypothetical protein
MYIPLVKLGRGRYAGAQIVWTYRLLVYFWGGTETAASDAARSGIRPHSNALLAAISVP